MRRAVVTLQHAYGYLQLRVQGLIKGDFQYVHHYAMLWGRTRLVAPSLNFIGGSWGPGACKGCRWLSGGKAGTARRDAQDADSALVGFNQFLKGGV